LLWLRKRSTIAENETQIDEATEQKVEITDVETWFNWYSQVESRRSRRTTLKSDSSVHCPLFNHYVNFFDFSENSNIPGYWNKQSWPNL
jgi:hypothetical protein